MLDLENDHLLVSEPSLTPSNADMPDEFICPITRQVMRYPVIAISNGEMHHYEASAILRWLNEGRGSDPQTNQPVAIIAYDHNLQERIGAFLGEHPDLRAQVLANDWAAIHGSRPTIPSEYLVPTHDNETETTAACQVRFFGNHCFAGQCLQVGGDTGFNLVSLKNVLTMVGIIVGGINGAIIVNSELLDYILTHQPGGTALGIAIIESITDLAAIPTGALFGGAILWGAGKIIDCVHNRWHRQEPEQVGEELPLIHDHVHAQPPV